MSGGLWMLVGFVGWFVAWFAYRWFRPSASQRRLIALADWTKQRQSERERIIADVARGDLTPREAAHKLMRL